MIDPKEILSSGSMWPLIKTRSFTAHWRRELSGRRVVGMAGEASGGGTGAAPRCGACRMWVRMSGLPWLALWPWARTRFL